MAQKQIEYLYVGKATNKTKKKKQKAQRKLENTQENTILILLHYIITKALWNQLHKVHKTIIIDFYTHGQICS